MQAGHYIGRGWANTFVEERNVHVQCYRCNIALKGNLDEYAIRLKKDYGEGILEELHKEKHKTKCFTTGELEEKISHYKELLNLLISK